jgi:hypothetical protein
VLDVGNWLSGVSFVLMLILGAVLGLKDVPLVMPLLIGAFLLGMVAISLENSPDGPGDVFKSRFANWREILEPTTSGRVQALRAVLVVGTVMVGLAVVIPTAIALWSLLAITAR